MYRIFFGVTYFHVSYSIQRLKVGVGIGQVKPGFDRPEPGLRKNLQVGMRIG
jgi:hypothetical protein